MATVEEKVIKIVSEQLDVDVKKVVPTASFVDDLGADSLDQVELDISIPDDAAEKIRTVQDAIDYIMKAMEG